MQDFTLEEIKNKFDNLPERLKMAISASDADKKINTISRENGLNINQTSELLYRTHLVFFGLTKLDEFEDSIKKITNIPPQVVRGIERDIKEKILADFLDDINALNEKPKEEIVPEVLTEPENDSSSSDKQQIATEKKENDSILMSAGIEIVPSPIETKNALAEKNDINPIIKENISPEEAAKKTTELALDDYSLTTPSANKESETQGSEEIMKIAFGNLIKSEALVIEIVPEKPKNVNDLLKTPETLNPTNTKETIEKVPLNPTSLNFGNDIKTEEVKITPVAPIIEPIVDIYSPVTTEDKREKPILEEDPEPFEILDEKELKIMKKEINLDKLILPDVTEKMIETKEISAPTTSIEIEGGVGLKEILPPEIKIPEPAIVLETKKEEPIEEKKETPTPPVAPKAEEKKEEIVPETKVEVKEPSTPKETVQPSTEKIDTKLKEEVDKIATEYKRNEKDSSAATTPFSYAIKSNHINEVKTPTVTTNEPGGDEKESLVKAIAEIQNKMKTIRKRDAEIDKEKLRLENEKKGLVDKEKDAAQISEIDTKLTNYYAEEKIIQKLREVDLPKEYLELLEKLDKLTAHPKPKTVLTK